MNTHVQGRRSLTQKRQGELVRSDQAFNHQLATGRDWDEALDVIYWLLMKKWYFTAIGANTKRGAGGRQTQSLHLQRRRKQLPDELQAILKMKLNSLTKTKDKSKVLSLGLKDVWHMKTPWEEFPEGTKIIEIYQSALSSLIKSTAAKKRAYIILDGKANTVEVNTAMKVIHKIVSDKGYTARMRKEVRSKKAAGGTVVAPKLTKQLDYKGARSPGGLLLLLLDEPVQVRGVSDPEFDLLKDYLMELKRSGRFEEEHERIAKLIKTQLQHRAQAGQEPKQSANAIINVDLFSQI